MAVGEPRPEKVAVVDDVRERLSSADAALLTEYRGLSVADLARLRQAVREAGGEYKIYKNTLVRLAVRDLGLTELEELLVGPTAIAFVSGDAVMVAKSLREFSRGNPNLVVKGGVLGKTLLTSEGAGALADVPPREVLLGQLAGAFAAPLRQMASLLQALPRNLAYGLAALVEQKGGAPEAAEVADAPAPPADDTAASEASDGAVAAADEPTDAAAAETASPESDTDTPDKEE